MYPLPLWHETGRDCGSIEVDRDRRSFLRTGAAALLAALPGATEAAPSAPPDATSMGVLVDLTRCNGCRRCEAACREANGFAVPTEEQLTDKSVFQAPRRPDPAQWTVVNRFESAGRAHPIYVKTNCLHCVDPACVSACLVGALSKTRHGAVTYDPAKCMGCRYCMVACPFQMSAYEYDNVFTPQVRKCTFCVNAGARPGDTVPACVSACPKECLTYARRSDLLRSAHKRIAEQPELYVDRVYGEHEAGGTSWLYLSPVPFEQLGFPMLSSIAPPRLSEAIQHGVFSHFMPPIALCVILALASWLMRVDGEGDDEASRSTVHERRPRAWSARRDGRGRSAYSHAARNFGRISFKQE